MYAYVWSMCVFVWSVNVCECVREYLCVECVYVCVECVCVCMYICMYVCRCSVYVCECLCICEVCSVWCGKTAIKPMR